MKKLLLAALLLFPNTQYAACATSYCPIPRYPNWNCCIPYCYNWSGYYCGLHGGYGFDRVNYGFPVGDSGSGPNNLFAPFSGGSFAERVSGGVLGGHAGVNSHLTTFVLSFEAAFDWSGIRGQRKNVFHEVPPNVTYKTDIDWFLTLTPRIGVPWDALLIYAKTGLIIARLSSHLSSTDTFLNATPHRFSASATHYGWLLGVGLELARWTHWVLGLEFNYYRPNRRHFEGKLTPSTGFPFEYSLRPSFNTFVTRISYKFCLSR